MALVKKKILAQKLKNPITKDWIETSYVAADKKDDTTYGNPVVYMHGILADTGSVDGQNIKHGVINDNHLVDASITNSKINWTTIFTTKKLSNNTYKIIVGKKGE